MVVQIRPFTKSSGYYLQGCGTHDHTHTDPSPEVSGEEGSLESRSQELLEKCSSLLTSSLESPPAQKYLNTLERSPPPPPPPPLTGSTGGGVASGSGFRPGQGVWTTSCMLTLCKLVDMATFHLTNRGVKCLKKSKWWA